MEIWFPIKFHSHSHMMTSAGDKLGQRFERRFDRSKRTERKFDAEELRKEEQEAGKEPWPQ